MRLFIFDVIKEFSSKFLTLIDKIRDILWTRLCKFFWLSLYNVFFLFSFFSNRKLSARQLNSNCQLKIKIFNFFEANFFFEKQKKIKSFIHKLYERRMISKVARKNEVYFGFLFPYLEINVQCSFLYFHPLPYRFDIKIITLDIDF